MAISGKNYWANSMASLNHLCDKKKNKTALQKFPAKPVSEESADLDHLQALLSSARDRYLFLQMRIRSKDQPTGQWKQQIEATFSSQNFKSVDQGQ